MGRIPQQAAAGMAAGFLFCPEGDESSREVKTYLEENGILAALEKYCNVSGDEPLAAMVAEEYGRLVIK